jgi:predicted Co/Zn/Cd cation transporter (cation efflux family)
MIVKNLNMMTTKTIVMIAMVTLIFVRCIKPVRVTQLLIQPEISKRAIVTIVERKDTSPKIADQKNQIARVGRRNKPI